MQEDLVSNFLLLKGVLLACGGVCKACELRDAFVTFAHAAEMAGGSRAISAWARTEAAKVMSMISHLRTLKRKTRTAAARPGCTQCTR